MFCSAIALAQPIGSVLLTFIYDLQCEHQMASFDKNVSPQFPNMCNVKCEMEKRDFQSIKKPMDVWVDMVSEWCPLSKNFCYIRNPMDPYGGGSHKVKKIKVVLYNFK